MTEIQERLFALQDPGYRDFNAKLLPTVDKERIIGVRTPALRALAKELDGSPEAAAFLAELPHAYFDEDQVHAFLVARIRDFRQCVEEVDRFLPYVDNWATCDQMSPAVFRKNREALLPHVRRWMADERTYVRRFGIGMLMEHYLDSDFRPEYPGWVAELQSEEYYVNMMRAWYFATALAKQWDAALPYLERGALDRRTHELAIRKAAESRRICPERKELLRGLRRKDA